MSALNCPNPQVGEALAPYIHSRQETQRIRQAISHHLASVQQGGQHDPLLSCAAPTVNLDQESGSLNGLHKRYYEALRANAAARESYARVKQELDELKSERAQELSKRKDENGQASVQAYVKLQRQRQQHAKLDIIQDTLAKLTEEAPRALQDDLGAIVKDEVGEAPDTPKTSLPSAGGNAEVEELVFRLKRELLLAKHAAERPRTSQEGHTNGHQPSPAAQIQALRAARDQLIAWIEGELAKIPEGEGNSSMLEPDMNGHNGGQEQTTLTEEQIVGQIQSLYDNYVAARQRLVHSIDDALSATSNTSPGGALSIRQASLASESKPQRTEKITHADLATAMPAMIQTARTERDLLQQSSYLRRQLAAAAEETKAIVQRLAGESYLVSPDASSMQAWATSAAAKNEETNAFLRGQVAAGQASVDTTAERLGRVERRNKALSELRGDL